MGKFWLNLSPSAGNTGCAEAHAGLGIVTTHSAQSRTGAFTMQVMQRRSEVASWPMKPDSEARAEHATPAQVYREHSSGQGGVTPWQRDTVQELVEKLKPAVMTAGYA